MLFFVSAGMLLDLPFLYAHYSTVLIMLGPIILGKAVILIGLVRVFGYRGTTALNVGLGIFQIGEFAFLLGRVGLAKEAIRPGTFSLLLAAAVITMILTPFAMRLADPMSSLYYRWRRTKPLPLADMPRHALKEHIIIAGYGRVGSYTAEVLRRLRFQCVAIELDQHAALRAQSAGVPIIFGDAGSPVVLEAAGVREARLLLVTAPAAFDVELIVSRARQLNKELHIIARAAQMSQMEHLHELGAHELVQPESESALQIVRQALLQLDMPMLEIQRFTDAVRKELYEPLYRLETDASLLQRLQRATKSLEIEWITLPGDSSLIGKSAAQAEIRQQTGASIVTVLRGEVTISNPAPEMIFEQGDILAVLGTAAQREKFREKILQ